MKKIIAILLVISSLTMLSSCSWYFAEIKPDGASSSGGLGGIFGSVRPESDEKITVPNFVGTKYNDLHKNESYAPFGFSIDYDYNSEYEAGVICEQSPEPGTEIDPMQAISITISRGVEMERVPDVLGEQLKYAKGDLEAQGFTVVVKYEADHNVEKDCVIKTDPLAGAKVPVGSEITVYVSSGSAS